MTLLGKRILFLVSNDSYVFSHRLHLLRFLKQEGMDVHLAAQDTGLLSKLADEGICIHPLKHLSRGGRNPFHDVKAVWEIWRLYGAVKPDIVYQVAMKPVVYGSWVAYLRRVPAVVNALGGLGFLFTSARGPINALIKACLTQSFRFLFKRAHWKLIIQNQDDWNDFCALIPAESLALIKGAGVNVTHFTPSVSSAQLPFVFLFPARLLKDKGIDETLLAHQHLLDKGYQVELWIAGDRDPENPASLTEAEVEEGCKIPYTRWLGKVYDMATLFQQVHAVVLPSYREGLPKALLEAAVCEKPIVTTNVRGCREIVQHGHTGLLVPSHNGDALAGAMMRIIDHPELAQRLGKAARANVLQEMTEESVQQQNKEMLEKIY